MMKLNKLVLFVAAAIVAGACGCTKPRELPPTDGTFERYTKDMVMHSDILGTDVKFSVYLPASYVKEKDRHYSVVYMLHGLGDNNNSWNGNYLHANTRIQSLENSGLNDMIYVFPSGFSTYYCNYYNGNYNYMDMFIKEFVPYVDKCFRTIPDAGHRSLTGYSMGGFGAMALAEKNPDVFCCSAPLSMSFRTDAQYMTESQSGWDGQWGKIFGGVGKAGEERLTDYYKEHCPYYQFVDANRSELEKVKWFFICGDDEEQLLIANDSLHTLLRDRNFAHEYRVVNGGHSSSVWNDALLEVLPLFDHYMNGASQWPAIKEASRQDVLPAEDGTMKSVNFNAQADAVGVYFFHYGLSDAEIADAMATLYSPNTTFNFIYLPCDLSKKSLSEWEDFYASIRQGKKIAVAFGKAGADVMDAKADFTIISFISADLGGRLSTAEGERYYFSCTDDDDSYASMGALYCSCKRSGASFEYRVVDASDNAASDRLRCIEKIKQYITY